MKSSVAAQDIQDRIATLNGYVGDAKKDLGIAKLAASVAGANSLVRSLAAAKQATIVLSKALSSASDLIYVLRVAVPILKIGSYATLIAYAVSAELWNAYEINELEADYQAAVTGLFSQKETLRQLDVLINHTAYAEAHQNDDLANARGALAQAEAQAQYDALHAKLTQAQTADNDAWVNEKQACNQPPKGATGTSHGDTHLSTFDQNFYDLQQVGEFVLARSNADDFQVQVRQQPWGNSCTVSVNTAAAFNVAGDRVSVYLANPGVQTLVNDHAVSLSNTAPLALPGGGLRDCEPGRRRGNRYLANWLVGHRQLRRSELSQSGGQPRPVRAGPCKRLVGQQRRQSRRRLHDLWRPGVA